MDFFNKENLCSNLYSLYKLKLYKWFKSLNFHKRNKCKFLLEVYLTKNFKM